MRTKFKISMAVAGAMLATAAIPSAVENSSVQMESTDTVELQLLASGVNTLKRPLIARAEELNDKESA